jgi:methylmalonyl-CoA mutase N-terminal domain/subunit
LYRRNLSKGQVGLSVAFDLPTSRATTTTAARRGRQGRRADRPQGDMHTLMDDIRSAG